MPLPDPEYFTLEQLSKRWDKPIDEILNYISSGNLQAGIMTPNKHYSEYHLEHDFNSCFERIHSHNFDKIHKDKNDNQYIIEKTTVKGFLKEEIKTENILLEQLKIPLNNIQWLEKSTSSKELYGETYNNLMEAIKQFPEHFPNYKTKALTKSTVESWLKTKQLATNDRESATFSKILKEHYNYLSDIK